MSSWLPLGRPFFSQTHVPGLGAIWSIGGLASDMSTLAGEVDEYFELGLRVEAGQCVVDVGANVGVFSIAAGARASGPLRFHAIEPIPVLHEALARNFRDSAHLSGSTVQLVRAGITNAPNELEAEFTHFLRLPRDSTRYAEGKQAEFERAFDTWGHEASAWICDRAPRGLPHAMGHRLGSFIGQIPQSGWTRWLFERAIGTRTVRCPMMPLARVLETIDGDIDVLKIDIEGAELDALQSVAPDQWKRVRQVVVETNDMDDRLGQLCELLRSSGLSDQVVAEPKTSTVQHLQSALVLARGIAPAV